MVRVACQRQNRLVGASHDYAFFRNIEIRVSIFVVKSARLFLWISAVNLAL